jgi:hypothetical protein
MVIYMVHGLKFWLLGVSWWVYGSNGGFLWDDKDEMG